MRFDLTVNEFTMEMLTKKHLVVFGEQFWRPYVHVRDAARASQRHLLHPSKKSLARYSTWAPLTRISRNSNLSI